VTQADLATNWRNDVPVLATPVLLWLTELACMDATDTCIETGSMTVGYQHDVRHLAATPHSWNVQIVAELVEIDGKMLKFEIAANDGQDEILQGFHTRAIIKREPFLDRLQVKARAFA
jgi:predicted thioesterase